MLSRLPGILTQLHVDNKKNNFFFLQILDFLQYVPFRWKSTLGLAWVDEAELVSIKITSLKVVEHGGFLCKVSYCHQYFTDTFITLTLNAL
jgi:hypothetical protein